MTFGFRALSSSSPGHTRAGRRFAYAPSSRRSWRSAVSGTAFRRPGIKTGIADRAEQHGVSRATGLEGFRRQRRLAGAKRRAPDHGAVELEFVNRTARRRPAARRPPRSPPLGRFRHRATARYSPSSTARCTNEPAAQQPWNVHSRCGRCRQSPTHRHPRSSSCYQPARSPFGRPGPAPKRPS